MQPTKVKCDLAPKLSTIVWKPCRIKFCRRMVKVMDYIVITKHIAPFQMWHVQFSITPKITEKYTEALCENHSCWTLLVLQTDQILFCVCEGQDSGMCQLWLSRMFWLIDLIRLGLVLLWHCTVNTIFSLHVNFAIFLCRKLAAFYCTRYSSWFHCVSCFFRHDA